MSNIINTKRVIVVTGGAGFIGSHLIEKLKEDNSNIIISLDNYFTGSTRNHFDGVTYIKGHTKDIDLLITTKPDIVYHLGEYSRVEKSFDDIIKVFDYNQTGTFAVLEFCKKHKSKIVYAGSSTKFANEEKGSNQSPYAWTKASNVDLVKNYGTWFGINYAITYFYNVYGGREMGTGDYATVVAIFKEKYKKGEPLEVVSPGTQLRNFTNIEDIVSGLIAVGENGKGDGYGIGSEKSYSILDLAKMFDSKIIMTPERRGNRLSAQVNIEKMKKEFNWQTNHDLKEDIKNYILSIEKNERVS